MAVELGREGLGDEDTLGEAVSLDLTTIFPEDSLSCADRCGLFFMLILDSIKFFIFLYGKDKNFYGFEKKNFYDFKDYSMEKSFKKVF